MRKSRPQFGALLVGHRRRKGFTGDTVEQILSELKPGRGVELGNLIVEV
jgi:hypothetical protein